MEGRADSAWLHLITLENRVCVNRLLVVLGYTIWGGDVFK